MVTTCRISHGTRYGLYITGYDHVSTHTGQGEESQLYNSEKHDLSQSSSLTTRVATNYILVTQTITNNYQMSTGYVVEIVPLLCQILIDVIFTFGTELALVNFTSVFT